MKSLTVAITGTNGNLGRKLIQAFTPQDWCGEILGIDIDFSGEPIRSDKFRPVEADLVDRHDRRWQEAIEKADAVVHLAARNPYPDATWEESAASFDMTINVVEACTRGKPRRLVFATSNHVMGRYKDRPEGSIPRSLKPDTPPQTGTIWRSAGQRFESTAYAVAKLMGERLCVLRASPEALTAVAIRIGWCQPGENLPATISPTGKPIDGTEMWDEEGLRDLRWFRDMWLSNRDFTGIVQAAILADASGWPAPGIVVNAMSANRDMPWDLEPTIRYLGYQPQDDVGSVLDQAARPEPT